MNSFPGGSGLLRSMGKGTIFWGSYFNLEGGCVTIIFYSKAQGNLDHAEQLFGSPD